MVAKATFKAWSYLPMVNTSENLWITWVFFFCQGFFESFLEFKESLCWKFPALRTNSVPSFYVLRVFT